MKPKSELFDSRTKKRTGSVLSGIQNQSEINHIWKFPAAGFIRNRRRVLDPENRAAPEPPPVLEAAGEKTIRRFFFLLLFSLIFPLFPGSRPRLDSGKPAGLLHGTGAL